MKEYNPRGLEMRQEYTQEQPANIIASQIFGVAFKKRAPRAIKEIRAFATQAMVRSTPPS
jgi:ribosomal protein L31E